MASKLRDCTNLESFDNVIQWMVEIDHYARNDVKIVLVGTKCDLLRSKVVRYETAKECADQLQIPFFETSAKGAINVEQAFVTLVKQIKNGVDLPLSIARPAKRMKTEHRLIESSASDTDRETNLDVWWSKMKEIQENTTKVTGELTDQLKEVASGVAAIGNKFSETVNRIEKLENKEETATAISHTIGEKILCESCLRNVKVKLDECNVL